MKNLFILMCLLLSHSLWADLVCRGSGLEISVFTSSDLRAEIRHEGTLIAESTDVSDLSAFELHYVGNFKRSSFDLRVKENGVGKVTFDNFIYSSAALNCRSN